MGFIVSYKDPQSQVWFDSGNGFTKSLNGGTTTTIYNVEYYEGTYQGRILVIDEDKNWQEDTFDVIDVIKPPLGKLMSSFTQSSTAGHIKVGVRGSGVHVKVGFTSSVDYEKVEWDFGYEPVENHRTNSHGRLYDRDGMFEGHVKVTGVNTTESEQRNFIVILKKLLETDREPIYFTRKL